ncbi:hypothetical protein RSAG8_05147, partial [Rhizoctonia solani AG-8 WAC10335]
MLMIGIQSSPSQARVMNSSWSPRGIMEVGESRHYDDCYFPHGDVLVKMQVVTTPWHVNDTGPPDETVDFKLHRDILLRYSGFFRKYYENRVLPEDHVQHPTLLEVAKQVQSTPADLQRLCWFMYPDPSAIGTLPHIEAGDIETWGSTVKATIEFDMPAIRAYILTKLTQDEAKLAARATSLLKWAMSLNEDKQELVSKCYRSLEFRRLPPSLSDLKDLSEEVVQKIILVRERARSLFLDYRKLRSWMPTPPPTSCTQPLVCQGAVIDALVHSMTNPSPHPDRFASIFELLETDGMCRSCRLADLLDPFKQKLNSAIDHYLGELNGDDGIFSSAPNSLYLNIRISIIVRDSF